MKKLKLKFEDLSNRVHHIAILGNLFKWMVLGSIVGIVIGAASALFLVTLEKATNIRINNSWLIYLLPLAGAFVSFLYTRYGKTSAQGNNLILDKINTGDKDIPLRMAPLVFIGTIITHLFGGSAGREGTAVQMGGSIAECIGKIFKLDENDQKIILMCGISSGFGSVFGTPLAGTIFGVEVIAIGAIEYSALIPCFISAFIGDIVTTSFGISHGHHIIQSVPELTAMVVAKVIIASVLFGVASIIFSEGIHVSKKVFSKLFSNNIVKTIAGGIVIILLTKLIGTMEYSGLSLPLIDKAFTGEVPTFAFLMKIIFTSITLGSGFQGGEVTPFFLVGATLGNALSGILSLPPSFLAALGMVAIFSGATNTPISSFFLAVELFHGQAVVFLFMACVIGFLFSGYHGIYTSQRVKIAKGKVLDLPHNLTLNKVKHFYSK